eukprot:TRINITY_DN9000_c0_g1_i1.p1 TRINITY_DN9000_c0_g1~~TRINITY_DN9000_c0_g1_i1.p1  ORF type:complete len:1360 (+),score=378.94 TRINITY_DN9000_c0_g1_i1:114-4193(+)
MKFLLSVRSTSQKKSLLKRKDVLTLKSKSINTKFWRNYSSNASVHDLIDACASGDMEKLVSLTEAGADLNGCDYDQRYPLHLAAAEGHLDVVKFLVSKGCNIHVSDRWGNSPISEAAYGEKSDVVEFLKQSGGVMSHGHGVSAMCIAAANDDFTQIKELVSKGHSVNTTDYDNRTPLHIAALKGNYEIVQYLINNKADINAVDQYGHTPLSDANRGASLEKMKIINLLKENGAQLSTDYWDQRNDPEFIQHIINCLEIVGEGYNFQYGEIWIPNDEGTFMFPSESFYAQDLSAAAVEFHYTYTEGIKLKKGEGLQGLVWESENPVILADAKESVDPQRLEGAEKFGMKNGVGVPIIHHGRTLCVITLYTFDSQFHMDSDSLSEFSHYLSGLVNSALFRGKESLFDAFPVLDRSKMQGIFEYIVAQGVFNSKLAFQDVVWFYKLGISAVYFQKYSVEEIGKHLHALAAAKKLAQVSGDRNNIWLDIKSENQHFFVCPATFSASLKIEQKIERLITNIPADKSISVTYLCSDNPVYPEGSRLNIYILETDTYVQPNAPETETSLWKVSTPLFLSDKTSIIRDRYQNLLNEHVDKISPSLKIHDVMADGTIPVTLTVKAGRVKPQLVKFTEVIRSLDLSVKRKFIETFANDMTVYSFYIEGDMETVKTLANEMSLIVSVPHTELVDLFIADKLSSKAYVYASSVSRFIYYFLQKRDDSVLSLEKALEKNPEDVARFRILRSKLSGEAASMGRIYYVISKYPQLVSLLFEDFEERTLKKNPNGAENVQEIINSTVTNAFDRSILSEFLTFNASVLKTNFYKVKKAALSFRLNPSFVTSSDFPENPYGIFWVFGPYFQGFHVRFRDVSRGGIRLIFSRNIPAYDHNISTLFQENYGLAHTQNRKNKDIPEFGSKGTILLHADSQSLRIHSFRSYVSALLDLLVIDDPAVVDLYNQEEILFLGPDENTADVMEWASLYAKSRNYQYYKAFTTGKPPALGGVPHDSYGMTTRSVHQYVLGCLEKMGLKEEEITKLQTGGPDGDLGSNEITISKDKTVVIVDGSGVIYDPAGLNREELTRLATERVMIENFDESLLGPGGFRVLVTDENVTLPNGELVKNGLQFRNDFHLHPLSSADLFVPCGGRPSSVNLNNVQKFFNKDGTPRFKIIVEGANLFITQDARLILEKRGVVLYKDASANKGGVTSSSLEVLAALALSEEEHNKYMCVKDEPPKFYKEYVEDIKNIIEENARKEFNAIWNEHQRLGTPRAILTDQLSDKINELNTVIAKSDLYNRDDLRRQVLKQYLPPTLLKAVPFKVLEQRVPENYLQSIFSTTLAASFVYKYGLNSNEFSFFEFLQGLLDKTEEN